MNVIDIDGVRFIKASDAADQTGYTTDYIGQLSRAGKIEAKRIGRVWYVREEDVLSYKKNNRRSNKEKTLEHIELVKKELPHEIHNSLYNPALMPEYRKRLLHTKITYERDNAPLDPPFSREDDEAVHIRLNKVGDVVAELDHDTEVVVEGSDNIDGDDEELKLEVDVIEKNADLSFKKSEPLMEGELSITDLEIEEQKEKNVHTIPHPHHVVAVPPNFVEKLERVGITSAVDKIPVIERSVARPFVFALVPLAVMVAFCVSFSSVFLQRVLVYERGESIKTGPVYKASYNLAAVSSVLKQLSR